IRSLLVIDPETAHRVVHAGEDFHGRVAGIVADELFVDLENAFEFLVENLAVDVGKVEVDHRLAVDAEIVLVDDLEDGASGDIARDQVAVLGIPLFEEVPALAFGNALGITLVSGRFPDPAAAPLDARGVRLRRGRIQPSGAACLLRESKWDGPG